MGGKIRIGALISGGGSNLQAIMDACEAGMISIVNLRKSSNIFPFLSICKDQKVR